MKVSIQPLIHVRGVPHWRAKSSGVRQSKIYECHGCAYGLKRVKKASLQCEFSQVCLIWWAAKTLAHSKLKRLLPSLYSFIFIQTSTFLKKINCGIRCIDEDWFTSYLKNRKQMVTVNGTASDLVTVPCGIPQGSVLGPILFLSYMNDYDKCSNLLDFHLFADDANLFYRHRDIVVLRQHINTELKCK